VLREKGEEGRQALAVVCAKFLEGNLGNELALPSERQTVSGVRPCTLSESIENDFFALKLRRRLESVEVRNLDVGRVDAGGEGNGVLDYRSSATLSVSESGL
jgi:hypothetical protein